MEYAIYFVALLISLVVSIGVAIWRCCVYKKMQRQRREQQQHQTQMVLQNPTYYSVADPATGQQNWYLSTNGTGIPPGAVMMRNPHETTTVHVETQMFHTASYPRAPQAAAPLTSPSDPPPAYLVQQENSPYQRQEPYNKNSNNNAADDGFRFEDL